MNATIGRNHKLLTCKKGALAIGLVALFCSVLLPACSDDLLDGTQDTAGNEQLSGESIYLSLTVAPNVRNAGTRTSYSDSDDKLYGDNTENKNHRKGETWENEISNLGVVLVEHSTAKVLFSVDLPLEKEYTEGNTPEASGKAELKLTDQSVKEFLDLAKDDKIIVDVIAVCNYKSLPERGTFLYDEANLLKLSDQTPISDFGGATGRTPKLDSEGKPTDEYDAVPHYFLMTNADFANANSEGDENYYKKEIDVKELKKHNKISDPYILNKTKPSGDKEVVDYKIPVQRVLARVDFCKNTNKYYFNQYGEYQGFLPEHGEAEEIDWKTVVALQYIGVLNVNKNFSLTKGTGVPTGGDMPSKEVNISWGYFWSELANGDEASSEDNDGIIQAGKYTRFVRDPKYNDKVALTQNTYDGLSYKGTSYSDFYNNYIFDPATFNDNRFTGNGATQIYTDYEGFTGLNNTSYSYGSDKYYVWTYITPNTIHEPEKQKVSISTGIIFVGQMNFYGGFGEGTERNYEHKDHPEWDPAPMYFWAGTPIGTNIALQRIVKDPKDAREKAISEAYKDALGMPTGTSMTLAYWAGNGERKENGTWTDTQGWTDFTLLTDWDGDDEAHKTNRFKVYQTRPTREDSKKLIDNGFAIYIPTDPQGDGHHEYMCWYYGWLRHNNNGKPDKMGPMEFGVVRNNIYQAKVNEITHIGHPFPDEEIYTDPYNPTPDEDDELTKPWIDLSVKAVDWKVKVNDDIGLGH